MAKRFIDTDLFKKRFIRDLPPAYKLLWVYLFCECDNAGIWEVDLEVAGLYCGETYDLEDFEKAFAGRIHFFNNGSKAFLQYRFMCVIRRVSNLNPTNNAHKSVLQKLEKYDLIRVLNEGITQLPQGPILGAGKPQGSGKAAPKTKGGKIFQKPTLEEVAAYCQERGNDVDPQAWIDYYTSNGWKVGRNCMKDWKAAVRTWERNEIGNNGNGRKGQQTGAATGGLNPVPGGTSKKKYTDTL